MSFPRSLPERAFDARDLRSEGENEDRSQLLSVIAVLIDAMDSRNYASTLEWQLAMTIVRNNARKLLKRYDYQVPS